MSPYLPLIMQRPWLCRKQYTRGQDGAGAVQFHLKEFETDDKHGAFPRLCDLVEHWKVTRCWQG